VEVLSATEPNITEPDSPGLLPIRAVAQITGVNPITLRAWERRYGLIRPTRTPAGHRLYSQGDVERIQRIQKLAEQGIGFAQIATIFEREEPEIAPPSSAQTTIDALPDTPQPQSVSQSEGNLIERVIDATIHLDARVLREAEVSALLWLSPQDYLRDVLIEALARLEMRSAWPDRDIGLTWLGEYIKGRFEWVLSAEHHPNRPTITVDFVLDGSVPVRAAGLWLLTQLFDPRYNLKLLPIGLSHYQRERLVQRWQASLWVRITESNTMAKDAYLHNNIGTTRLHWCALEPLTAQDEQNENKNPWRDKFAGIIDRCQTEILNEMGLKPQSDRGLHH